MAFGMKNILQGGLATNYSEAPLEELEKEYGMYLMDNEKITMGFKLVRDALIFTDKRIIFTDKQGATGTKMSVESINLNSVIDVGKWKLPVLDLMIVKLHLHTSLPLISKATI